MPPSAKTKRWASSIWIVRSDIRIPPLPVTVWRIPGSLADRSGQGSLRIRRRSATLRPMPRLAVALVWLYQGLWCKLLARCPGHLAIVQAVPGLAGAAGTAVLAGLGTIEVGLAVWVLSGWRPRLAALAQT